MKRVPVACVLASVALIAVPAAASAVYYPLGPQAFVDKSQLDGWQPCFTDTYADTTSSLDGILSECNGDPLLLAGGPTGSPTVTVLAAAPRADVIFDTGHSNTPHNANGSGWYFSSDWSWGFAKQGDPIERNPCDDLFDPNPDLRLCWHTVPNAGFLGTGFRAGDTTSFGTDYTRYIYQGVRASNAFSFAVHGSKLRVSVKTSGKVSVSDAAVPLSASAAKKKRKLLLKPSSASGGAPTITVPISLTKAAKSSLKKKGKVTAKARITFTPEDGFPNPQSSTRTAKLKIKGKRKKK